MGLYFFFFQAEDGIRDLTVTGVQTCALPIWGLIGRSMRDMDRATMATAFATLPRCPMKNQTADRKPEDACDSLLQEIRLRFQALERELLQIGRASCRERV